MYLTTTSAAASILALVEKMILGALLTRKKSNRDMHSILHPASESLQVCDSVTSEQKHMTLWLNRHLV